VNRDHDTIVGERDIAQVERNELRPRTAQLNPITESARVRSPTGVSGCTDTIIAPHDAPHLWQPSRAQ
jgi:hypothetical protein